ncbi:Wzt C-terminal domain-containing protein [Parapedobacter luteus]|uniref:Wzt C-terminal domain-containing protein n=1 Tax=Parapedobacter luteus TaxID=623280 RepID=A0A1T5DFE3_9SPHI|nr:ABC transporter ATP-binding protein [Parapedobacter luteus]SKB70405.1 Wzt C-terminal domain-containing protein [Parapedobacter luteus]
MSNVVIKAENLSKQYRLGEVGTGTIQHDLKRWWYKVRGKEDPFLKIGETNDRTQKGASEFVWALKDINFEIEQGDVVGIIGRNGAGKSTLLKILSKTTLPTTGCIKAKGRIASLLEVGTGFHPELTGRDNIFLNGAILGMTKKEIKRKFDEIVDFSGVERYIDTPVKRYSSGMYVRLAFGVAAHLESEILIVDEVLAVGDAEFQKKAIGKMQDVSTDEGRTVLFVSHNMAAVKQLCNVGMLLENGTIKTSGKINTVLDAYVQRDETINPVYINNNFENEIIAVYAIKVLDKNFQLVNQHFHNECFYVNVSYKFKQPTQKIYFSIHIHDSELQTIIFSRDFEKDESFLGLREEGEYELNIRIPAILAPGKYNISLHISHAEPPRIMQGFDHICNFEIVPAVTNQKTASFIMRGKVIADLSWEVTRKPITLT